MVKRNILLFVLSSVCLLSFGVPARKVKKTLVLADGTQKEVVLAGDEFGHYYQAEDGSIYGGSETEGYRRLDASAFLSQRAAKAQQRNAQRKAKRLGSNAADITAASKTAVTGSKKGLVILVNYSDTKMKYTNADYADYFNLEGYKAHGMAGSVHDYFKDCSYGQFDLTFDVVGPVTVSKTLSYYGSNDASDNDKHPAEMVIEAIKLADAQGINFKDYDWDGDGEVDQVYVIYAGYGEAMGAASNTIWPHEWQLSSAYAYGDGTGALRLDGVKIDTYACSNELDGTSGTAISGIGTACHEFSHCMGIPDMYDVNYNDHFGMNCWDVMDYGSYNDDGYCPCGYTSYERWICGWLTPTEISGAYEVTDMPCLDASPSAYVIYNQANKNEYYLLENRQQQGWHQYDNAHGLLVVHVDYSKSAWEDNTVNTTSTQRMTIIPADNVLSEATLSGDTWPGTSKKTALTNTSTPAAKLNNANTDGKKLMNAPIEQIAEQTSKGTISFIVNGGIPVATPENVTVADVDSTGFKLSWSKVDMADSYEVKLDSKSVNPEDDEAKLMLSEDFSMLSDLSSTTDVSSSLDKYTSTSGWKGTKVYSSDDKKGVKIGSASAAGSITTPEIEITSGTAYLAVTMHPYNNDSPSVYVKYGDSSTEKVSVKQDDVYYFTLTDVESPVSFTISAATSSKCRFVITDIKVYDGVPSSDQSEASSQSQSAEKAVVSKVYTTTACQYVFEGLSNSKVYTVSVRALAEGKTASQWSEGIEVRLPAPEPGDEPGEGGGEEPGDGGGDNPGEGGGDNPGEGGEEPGDDPTPTPNRIIVGDMNGDGKITVADVDLLIEVLLGKKEAEVIVIPNP